MARDELAFLSAAETAEMIATKQVSPVDVVEAYLAHIERLDGHLRAYITVLRDQALAEAHQAAQALRRGEPLPPLFGVLMAVKDQFWTNGIPTTNGSRVYRDFAHSEDATIVTRLKQAGAILLGKLNLSELAMGGTQQPPYGIPRNPELQEHEDMHPEVRQAVYDALGRQNITVWSPMRFNTRRLRLW